MALIAMACFDTIENDRTKYTKVTLDSIHETVDLTRHRLFVIDNASCEATKQLLKDYSEIMPMTVITNEENIGTARAINKAWKQRKPTEHLLKMDNDVKFHTKGWLDLLEEAIERDPTIGQAACKRKDLAERPDSPISFYKSELVMLPHEAGQRWLVGERVLHCMGTCVLHNWRLIDKIGGLFQMRFKYGGDDSIMSFRANSAGFKCMFIHGIEIDHVDVGGDAYTIEKQRIASEFLPEYQELLNEYKRGNKSLYHPFE